MGTLATGLLCGAVQDRLGAEFSGRYGNDHHRRHRYGLHRGGGHLQLPHRKHSPCDRAARRLLFRFAVVRPGERRLAMRAVFFEIGKHEVMPCQQPITFAESRGRRILSRPLAFGCPSTITLRRRYVISHSPATRTLTTSSLLAGLATGQGVLWISGRPRRSRRRPRRSTIKHCGIGFGPDRCSHGLRPRSLRAGRCEYEA